MKYFVGIVPPENIYNSILDIQKQFGDNRLEPHITIRPPVIPTNADEWISTVDEQGSQFKSFRIHLPATGRFGKKVLFIDVHSSGLRQFYDKLIPALKPFEPVLEEDERPFHPHLTLGRSWCGFTKEAFDSMQRLADEFLEQSAVSFEVNSIRIYHKPGHSKRYKALKDIQLL